MEKEARKNQLNGIGHNHSRDSAIDADLQEWETEEVMVDIVSVFIYQALSSAVTGGSVTDPPSSDKQHLCAASITFHK